MSLAEVYVTSAIHFDGEGGTDPAVIRTQFTQYFDLKITVPRKGYRTAEVRVNIQSEELSPLASDGFRPYANFLYIKWRGHVVYWGPILTKEVDFEANSLKLTSSDQGVRLEHHYFRIGDVAMDDPSDPTKGHLTVNASGLHLGLIAGETTDNMQNNKIPLGIQMGSDHHTDSGHRVKIERGQEIWRTMLDLGDRDDGPLFDLLPLDISDGEFFAKMNVYGPYLRDDISSTVKLHYNTGFRNLRNIRAITGGEVLSHAHVLTQNNEWRTTTASASTSHNYGVWIQWEQVDFNLRDSADEAEAEAALGAVGDTILDNYGRPLTTVEITMRRDDQIHDATHQFFWIDDYMVGDVIEVQGSKGYESFDGNYLIDEVRLEQEADNSGEIRQAMDVIPYVEVGQYTYGHGTGFVELDD